MNPFLLRKAIYPAYHRLKNTQVLQRIEELEENQWKNHDELKELQHIKLKNLLAHAHASVPYYRELFDTLDINLSELHEPDNFVKLPTLDKEIISANATKLVSVQENKDKLISNSTSGSTGEKLLFYTDLRSWAYRRAVVMRNRGWLGIKLGDKVASIWGAPIDLNKARTIRGRIHSWANNILSLSSYDLGDQQLQNYANTLNRFKPKLLVSYPGPLSVFAEFLIATKQNISSVTAIISSAETLYPWQKTVIEEAFSQEVYNRYGSREFGDVSQECPAREGMHINSDRFIVECLDDDLNRNNPEEVGEIVVTDLDNYGMPLIRYRIGDMGALDNHTCSCGRALPLMKEVTGRTLDIVKAPNGNRLGGTFWTLLFRNKPGIKAFQVIQERRDQLLINFVSDPEVNNIPLQFFIQQIKDKCGDVHIRFEEVSTIPKTSSGKTRFVISKLNNQV